MSTNPYVDSKQLIDVEREKPYELIHERAFVNVSIATGWQPSDDGLYEYYKDIILPVADNEEPVTMSYSPMVIIPQNANPSCRPTNFPYARTVAINTVRLYAYRVPDPMAILPVTITVKEVMSNEGMTNAGAGGSDSNITIEKTVLQVKGTSFLVPVDNDNITTEEVKIEMYMTAYKGEEKTKATIGNIESIDVLFNMDGTVINTADNNIEITTLDGPLDDPNSAIFWATIPKGTLLKDKMAYFVVPISAGTPFHARSTLLTTRTGETVNKIARYEIFYPNLSRSSTGNYYQNGEAVGNKGIRFSAKSYTANGVSADVDGKLVFRDNTNNDLKERSTISAGVVDVEDTSIFNGINDLKIELEIDGKVVQSVETSITTSVSDIYIRTSSDYLVPIMSDNGSIVPAASVELWVHTSTNFVEQFYGRILVKNEDGTTLIDSITPVTKVRIEEKEYDSSSIPAFYRVDVFRPGELVPAATKFISILKKGDATIPVMLDVTPSAMIILADKDGNIPSDIENVFKARVLKGVNDVSTDWVFSQSVVSGIVDISQTGNTFKVTSISSQAAVVEVSATMSDGVDVLTQQMTITKIVQSDNGGNYTFLKYGELIMDDEDETGSANGTYQFTIDPDGILPPGVVKGSYYGIAISEVDEAPTDPAVYIWSPTGSLDSTNGQQEIPTGSFIIDGESIIKAVSDDTGEVVLYPNVGGYEVKSLGDVSAISYKWEYRAGDIWMPLTDLENDAATMSIDYSALPFNAYNSAAIRVKVQAVVNGEIRDYFAQLNIYIIYAAQASYFGQLRLIGGVDRYSHTFPIDRFGQAISGTTSTRDTVRLTADIYKGLDRLEAVDHDNNLGDGEYRVISVSDSGASLSHSIFENQFSAVYDFLIGSSGSTAVVIETRDNRLNLSFNWLTVNSQASISSSVIAIPDKTDFVINDATLWDIENWNDDISVSPVMLSSLDKNNPIIVDFETNNTNVEKVEISNSGGSDMYQIGTSLGYLQELEEGDPYKNLIKDDFSDFNAYQGATVTKNKTFPIDVFKGGRNLITNSLSHWVVGSLNGFNGEDYAAVSSLRSPYVELDEGNYIFSTLFKNKQSDETLITWIHFYNENKVGERSMSWSATNPRNFEIRQGEKYIRLLLRISIDGVNQAISLDELGTRLFAQVEKGDIATEWSPAPEDGYGLDLPNGAYHIQASGGDSRLKIISPNTKLDIGNNRNNKVTVHPFNTLQITNNYGRIEYMEINETTTFNKTAIGNGTLFNSIQFVGRSATDSLDFIASDPKIYINEKEVSGQMSPISVISSKESDGYHGFMLPENYYLVVTNSTGGTPTMDLFQDNIIVESLEMNNDYLFSGSRAMIVKPAAGVTRFVYSDPGDETPYIFKFNPVEKFHELITNQYFVGSKLNTLAAGLTAPMYGGILPIKYNEVTDQPYSFGVHPNGAGYMRIQPEIASRSTFFSNMFANSNTTIKVTATTGESTRFSVYRRVYPNKEISDIGNDIKSIFRGDYLDKSNIYSLETSSSIIKSERDQLVDMIEVVDVEAFEEERAPRDVDRQYYYESVGDLGQVYPIDTKASGLAVDEINHESVMGMSLFSDSYYFISVGLKSTAQVQAEISLVNRSTREVIGTIKKTVSTTEVPVKFVVPPAGVKTVDNKIQTYIKKYGLSTANVTDVFTRRTTNSDYAPYYLHVRVTSNNPPDTIDMVSNDVKELNEERVVRTNIYSGLSGKNPYEQMKSSTTLYIDTINTVIDRINNTADGDRIPTSDYPNLFSQFNEAKNFIEKTKTEMDIINRRGSMEATFRQSSDARGFIMGYANSQEYISSLQLTPLGLLVKGDKNQVVGSTSIGELYGKKIVIGKTITKEDIKFDKVYRNSTKGNEGFFAVWDENNKVWSSTINKDGQFFMRYRDSEDGLSLIGYMVMNSSEIAAYDFKPITTDLDLPEPVNVHEIQQKTSIFSINDNGSVSINKLVINDTPTRRASVDLMGVVRISKYTSADQSREGIVFTQIGGA